MARVDQDRPTTLFALLLHSRRGASSSRSRSWNMNPHSVGSSGASLPVGGAAGSGFGGAGAGCGNMRPQRKPKNEPRPAPHAAGAAGAGGVTSRLALARRLSGRMPGARTGAACAGGSASAWLISTAGVPRLLPRRKGGAGADSDWRCTVQRLRKPCTALSTFVEPAVSALATALRAGASCCSSLRSCRPLDSRSLMSATTDGFSPHGCLHAVSGRVRKGKADCANVEGVHNLCARVSVCQRERVAHAQRASAQAYR